MARKKGTTVSRDNYQPPKMRVVIQVAKADSSKAWSLLVRYSPGTALPNETFIVSAEAVKALRKAQIKFTEITREPGMPAANRVVVGKRV